jgi:hypothetical protein
MVKTEALVWYLSLQWIVGIYETCKGKCRRQIWLKVSDAWLLWARVQRSEKISLEPVTHLFQNNKKTRLEDTNQENQTRIEGTGSWSLSEKALGSVVYVKETDGVEMTDVEWSNLYIEPKKPKIVLLDRGVLNENLTLLGKPNKTKQDYCFIFHYLWIIFDCIFWWCVFKRQLL